MAAGRLFERPGASSCPTAARAATGVGLRGLFVLRGGMAREKTKDQYGGFKRTGD